MKYKNHLIYFIVLCTLWDQTIQDSSPLDEIIINLNTWNKNSPKAELKPGLDYQDRNILGQPKVGKSLPVTPTPTGSHEQEGRNPSPGRPSDEDGSGSGGCGRSAAHAGSRIAAHAGSGSGARIEGGVDAEPNEWPWQAALLEPSPNGPFQYCGGTLISVEHVLTAARCLFGYKINGLQVELGNYDLDVIGETGDVRFQVAKATIHELYNAESKENDIGIIKLDKRIIRTISVYPACLPPANENFTNAIAYVTGWGALSLEGKTYSILQEVDVRIWENGPCRTSYKDIDVPIDVKDTNICANGDKKDACQGDSGGPLNCVDSKTKHWVLCGITSRVLFCAKSEYPGVYTRVNSYLPWIKQNMKVM